MKSIKDTVFLVRKPFTGNVIASMTKADSDTMIRTYGTPEYAEVEATSEYVARQYDPDKTEFVYAERLTELLTEYENGLKSSFEKVTEEDFFYALEVLPPCRWRHYGGVEYFHVSERERADLVWWFAKKDGQHYKCLQASTIEYSDLALLFPE